MLQTPLVAPGLYRSSVGGWRGQLTKSTAGMTLTGKKPILASSNMSWPDSEIMNCNLCDKLFCKTWVCGSTSVSVMALPNMSSLLSASWCVHVLGVNTSVFSSCFMSSVFDGHGWMIIQPSSSTEIRLSISVRSYVQLIVCSTVVKVWSSTFSASYENLFLEEFLGVEGGVAGTPYLERMQ